VLAFSMWVMISGQLMPVAGKPAAKGEPIHSQIDTMIANGAGDHSFAALSDDAEFLRRVYLDFAGTIPDVSEVRKFLKDSSPSKSIEIIDSLISGPRYAQRMAETVPCAFYGEKRAEYTLAGLVAGCLCEKSILGCDDAPDTPGGFP